MTIRLNWPLENFFHIPNRGTWCAREDLNLQSFRNQILSLARLPFRHARVGEKMAWNNAKLKEEAPANSQRLNYFFEAAPFFLPFSKLVAVLASVVFLRVSNSLRSSRLDFCSSRTSCRKFLKSSTSLRPARRSAIARSAAERSGVSLEALANVCSTATA